MGRPRVHDRQTRVVLLDGAEQLVQREGVEALSVRRLADEVGASTRAVYSVFGSKAGLLDALGARAFDWLASALQARPTGDDPVADVVETGALTFRALVLEHPALLRVALGGPKAGPGTESYEAGDRALRRLLPRFARLHDAGMLGDRTIEEAAFEFHALCEGLAALELRGALPAGGAQRAWSRALTTLLQGLTGTRGQHP